MSPKNHRQRRRARRMSRYINMTNQSRVSRFINNNNSSIICQIIQIPTLQITNNDFADNLLNGTKFRDNDHSLEFLLLPVEFSTSFFP